MVHVRKIESDAQFVYFIQAGEYGPIKIGQTKDICARLRTHQIGNHEELTVLICIPCERGVSERSLHSMFREDLIRGEWFKPTARLLQYIETWKRVLFPIGMERKATRLTTGGARA